MGKIKSEASWRRKLIEGLEKNDEKLIDELLKAVPIGVCAPLVLINCMDLLNEVGAKKAKELVLWMVPKVAESIQEKMFLASLKAGHLQICKKLLKAEPKLLGKIEYSPSFYGYLLSVKERQKEREPMKAYVWYMNELLAAEKVHEACITAYSYTRSLIDDNQIDTFESMLKKIKAKENVALKFIEELKRFFSIYLIGMMGSDKNYLRIMDKWVADQSLRDLNNVVKKRGRGPKKEIILTL